MSVGDYLMIFILAFILFGEGTGDQAVPRADDASSSAISLKVPVIYYGVQQTSVYVRNRYVARVHLYCHNYFA